MSQIAACFSRLQSEGRRALIPYITAGDPNLEATLEYMEALVESGADLIELGVPFSDPMADGPVIQRAIERSLSSGTTLSGILKIVARFKEKHPNFPVVLMGYLNPFLRMGIEVFAKEAHNAGLDGLLIVDLPPEENHTYRQLFQTSGIDQIFLASPTTTDERLQKIAQESSGYLYYVALKGVTGAQVPLARAVSDRVEHIKAMTKLPVAVGFGIKDGASAAAIGQGADGVIVGSALVNKIGQAGEDKAKAIEAIGALTAEIYQALAPS